MPLVPPRLGLASRRELLASLGLGSAVWSFGEAHGLAMPSRAVSGEPPYRLDRESAGVAEAQVHGGDGLIRVKAFDFAGASKPSLMLLYLIPPGASEGVHIHQLGDRRLGSYDEFYYIVSGSGVMDLGGIQTPVTTGDHVFTPLGMPHGIRNTSTDAELKVFLTAMERS